MFTFCNTPICLVGVKMYFCVHKTKSDQFLDFRSITLCVNLLRGSCCCFFLIELKNIYIYIFFFFTFIIQYLLNTQAKFIFTIFSHFSVYVIKFRIELENMIFSGKCNSANNPQFFMFGTNILINEKGNDSSWLRSGCD